MITLSIIGGFALWLLGAVLVWEWLLDERDTTDELTASTWFLWFPFVLLYCVLVHSVRFAHHYTFGRWRK